MHPLLRLEETGIWPHRHRQIYEAYSKIFNLKQHGWLNIQSFQLNLPYSNEKDGILLYNLLSNICAYLPAITASSPIYEGTFGRNIDNRLSFYVQNQREIPSVTGDVVPEPMSSFCQYKKEIIAKYSADLAAAGADQLIIGEEWVNSRGVIFRFDRRALEVRVMDEQECIKSDVAMSCFIRALLRGSMNEEKSLLPHEVLVNDFNSVVANGLNAKTQHPYGKTARQVCQNLLQVARESATREEKNYLTIVQKRIEHGNLSDKIRESVHRRAQKTDAQQAIINVYSRLTKNLIDNQPYF
jgi:gamma-glutamyl:cysteine ligase YbdK (ATP-grasp superfamily)